MAIFVIGDLHLSLGADKPMDVFRGWQGYVERLEVSWRAQIAPEDTVVLAGDTSWAMKLEDTAADFAFLQSLPGKKLLVKGNHDYWWNSAAKMRAFFAAQGFTTLEILHNNAWEAEGCALCGTRGWMIDAADPQDEKVRAREQGRLKASLAAAAPGCEKLAFLHYPPVSPGGTAEGMVALLHEYGVRRCCYGHLHGAAIRTARQGLVDGIEYRLISADALGFCPLRLPATAPAPEAETARPFAPDGQAAAQTAPAGPATPAPQAADTP